MNLLVILLPLVAHSSLGSEELNVTQGVSDSLTGVTEVTESDLPSGVDDAANITASLQDGGLAVAQTTRPVTSKQASRGPRLARRKPRRSRRFRPGNGPRYREPVNVYNPYYRVPQTYYDAYYNPYQGYYPEYAQPGYYPQYPYQPQQPYPQPYPYPPPPQVVPTPPPTLAPIPDLYYVQNTDGHYQYRRVSVTRRSPEHVGHFSYDRRSHSEYRYPRKPGRPPAAPELRPQLRLTSAPHQAQVFSMPPLSKTTEPRAG